MGTLPLTGPATVGWGRMLGRAGTWAGTAARHGTVGAAESLRRRLNRNGRQPGRDRLTTMLVSLGPTFVKGGQLLGTRQDLLPPHLCAALGRLHDRVDPMTRAQAEEVCTHAYRERTWPFKEFDWTPSASGSIACVYRARLHDGREVAVKVRRPRIRERMHADFALLGKGASVIQRVPGMRKVPARRMVDQVGFAVLRQLDLDAEAAALTSLRANLTGLEYFRIPEPLPEACGEGVLVMEYLEGLGRFGPGELTREERRVLVRKVLHGVYQMLFLDGLVHCDMHPGNLYLTKDSEVVLLDAGFVVRLDPVVKRQFAEFFLNMSMGRGAECAEVVLQSSEYVPPDADLDGFRAGIVELVTAAHRRTAGQFRLAPFATRLFDLQRRSSVAAAPEFVFPLVSLLVLEGMINEFDVDVDFQAEAVPTLLTALRT
ncbi:ABC1 kinase family protein [Amycolatopsis sp. cmx-11-12]|uniref:ABC1 kinase family protein n=1 Tax=Amycolatopsis sp. cmx-11-12 TaxID=2785795 RepID=UPI003917C734